MTKGVNYFSYYYYFCVYYVFVDTQQIILKCTNINCDYFIFRFVQDLVNKDYFKQKPIKVLYRVIRLLEHIVVVFNLYNNEQKLKDMYDFLSSIVKPKGLSDTHKFIHILDQWNLRLFRLHINRKKVQIKIIFLKFINKIKQKVKFLLY